MKGTLKDSEHEAKRSAQGKALRRQACFITAGIMPTKQTVSCSWRLPEIAYACSNRTVVSTFGPIIHKRRYGARTTRRQ